MKDFLKGFLISCVAIMCLFWIYSSIANASTEVKLTPMECHATAEKTKTIHMAYKTGIKKETVLTLYSGNDEYNVRMRDVIHKIYTSNSKHMDSDAMYLVVYDICLTQ